MSPLPPGPEPGTDDEPCDREVIVASLGDPSRFAAVFDRHADGLHRYLDRRVGRDTADDLLGEVFRIAFERRASFRPDHDSARPWLFGIATNLVLKDRRREGRKLRALARLDPGETRSTDDLGGVDQRIDAGRSYRSVVRALLDLDPRDRDVVVLIAWESFSYDEVATALDIPVGTVRSRLNRARRQLRERVPDIGDDPVTTTNARLREVVCE